LRGLVFFFNKNQGLFDACESDAFKIQIFYFSFYYIEFPLPEGKGEVRHAAAFFHSSCDASILGVWDLGRQGKGMLVISRGCVLRSTVILSLVSYGIIIQI
jgi:hypothetical protein